jgi:hypothetical protein
VALSGALGDEGITEADEANDAGDAPAAFVATTLKVYEVPAVTFVIRHDVTPVVVHDPPGLPVTT